ncbi:MAG TPA: hypothetical protein VHM25_20355, partial [Polyangiaceae bacterium]|nr:hypothetical protein [Polyangiaceae bacterium]
MASYPSLCWGRLAFAGLFVSAFAQAEPSPNSAMISVNVGPLRNSKGSLGCRLHSSAEGFPRAGAGLVSRRVKIAGTTARCVFENV